MQGTHTDGGFIVHKLEAVTDDAEEGFRLSRHVAKMQKDKTYKGLQESLAVFLPITLEMKPFADEFPALNVAMQDAYDSLQDRYIRSLLETGKTVIYDADLTTELLEQFAASQPEGLGKLSGDKIKAWFSENLSDRLSKVLTEKLGAACTTEKLTQTLNSYRDIFARLAEKSPSFEPKVHENLQKAIAFATESPMTEKIAAKLLASAQKSVDLLAL